MKMIDPNAVPKAALDGRVQFGVAGLIEMEESPDIRVDLSARH